MFVLPPPPSRPNHWPSPENRSYNNYASRTVEPGPEAPEAPEAPEPPQVPPPVYTPIPALNRAPSYNFVVEEPPAYSQTSKENFTTNKRLKIFGIKLSTIIAFFALFVAGAIIAGGIYGYQNRPQEHSAIDSRL